MQHIGKEDEGGLGGRRHAAAGDRSPIPAHVAIIMDGNGRWAAPKRLFNWVAV